jgi:hypothetical protein
MNTWAGEGIFVSACGGNLRWLLDVFDDGSEERLSETMSERGMGRGELIDGCR